MIRFLGKIALTTSIAIVFFGCSSTQKIEALKPAPSYATDIVYEKQVSYFNLPVEITMTDLQGQINKYFNGLVYEDNVLEDDNMMVKVWKQGPIVLDERFGKIDMVLPLKIWAKVRYGFEQFGVKLYDTKELNLNGTIKLTSAVTFKNWHFTTTTEITGFDWAESPSVTIAGKNVPMTYLINPAVNLFKKQIAKNIDNGIERSMDIKPYVLNALEFMSKPTEVNKDYHVWLGLQPLELYSNQAVVVNKKVSITMGLKAYVETSINAQPSVKFDKTKLLLQGAEKLPADFGVTIAGIVTYANASALMQANFNGKKFESGKRSITVEKIDIWGKDGKMIIQLGMTGTINGNFYLSGIPKYDATKKEMYLDQLDFVLDSKNKLLQMGDWLAHGTIATKIKENCKYSIADQLAIGEKNVKTYLSGYEPVKGVKVTGSLTSLAPQKIVLTSNAIITTIDAKGKVAIAIDGMQ